MGVSEPRRVLVVGAGGHARVVLDTLLIQPAAFQPVGLTDPDPTLHGEKLLGVPIVGNDALWEKIRATGVDAAIAAVGDNRLRGRLADALKRAGFDLINALHPTAVISHHTQLGTGIAVMAGAVINAGTIIGDNVIINTGASVDHDCVIESDVHVAPGAQLGGCVHIARGALIGIGASVIPGIFIGAWSVVGAGAVAIRDVPPNTVVVGVPARALRPVT